MKDPWRIGSSLGLTVYDERRPCICTSTEQKCNCRCIGFMRTTELASLVVEALNEKLSREEN